MWRRLDKEDFVASNLLASENEGYAPFRWQVYDGYELLPSEGNNYDYVQASKPPDGREPKCVHVYNPLADTPRLFLDFARIWEHEHRSEALWEWILRYGLLGFTERNPQYSSEPWPEPIYDVLRYDDRGGPRDAFFAYLAEAQEANEALRLYEAVLNRDKNVLQSIIFHEENPDIGPAFEARKRRTLQQRMDATGGWWIDVLIDEALAQISKLTRQQLRAFVYPKLAFPGAATGSIDAPLVDVNQVTRGWGVRNLLGAIYLQFYWLVTSGGKLARCKYCGRTIAYAASIYEGGDEKSRRPRKDKHFCDDRCRQNYHYHNRIKLRRQGASDNT